MVSVLLVSSSAASNAVFSELSREFEWRVVSVPGFGAFASLLHTRKFNVVVCEADLPDGSWTDVLDVLVAADSPAALVVTAPLGDERLWVDVLHRGGYDVLAQPFDKREVERVIALARDHSGTASSARPGRNSAAA
jgi:DNA-binding response OmpR family regulator